MVKKVKDHWIVDQVPAGRAGQNAPVATATLLGAADDRGVLNVGGRLGAGHGPQAVRQMLSTFLLGIDGSLQKITLAYGHDITLGATIESGHQEMRRCVKSSLIAHEYPIVLGGGHDYGYPHVAGAHDAFNGRIALINIDAHLDVRPPSSEGITSGSPFYLALEEPVVAAENFVEFGIQEHCNDESYHRYLVEKRAKVMRLDETRQKGGVAFNFEKLISTLARKNLKIVVSFDVDAVQMAHAPGVSAPQSEGFTSEEFLAMARICGESSAVATIGFFELAPPLDENQKTTRLVATAIHRYLSALSRRFDPTAHQKNVSPVRRLLKRRK
ncbi:MAG: formimidoylglutamase [Bdellovibrionota bacterium]